MSKKNNDMRPLHRVILFESPLSEIWWVRTDTGKALPFTSLKDAMDEFLFGRFSKIVECGKGYMICEVRGEIE